MSAAHQIPEVIVDKITLMCYGINPHPASTLIKGYWVNKVGKTKCRIALQAWQEGLITDDQFKMILENYWGGIVSPDILRG